MAARSRNRTQRVRAISTSGEKAARLGLNTGDDARRTEHHQAQNDLDGVRPLHVVPDILGEVEIRFLASTGRM
jgi:hypothetical protein